MYKKIVIGYNIKSNASSSGFIEPANLFANLLRTLKSHVSNLLSCIVYEIPDRMDNGFKLRIKKIRLH